MAKVITDLPDVGMGPRMAFLLECRENDSLPRHLQHSDVTVLFREIERLGALLQLEVAMEASSGVHPINRGSRADSSCPRCGWIVDALEGRIG